MLTTTGAFSSPCAFQSLLVGEILGGSSLRLAALQSLLTCPFLHPSVVVSGNGLQDCTRLHYVLNRSTLVGRERPADDLDLR